VGSIKTVLGHTEGTAGIAAILKASLAMQNSCIPPNLLFNELSPAVAPFYGNLEILRAVRPWPEVPKNQPKRISVNSFGFGGANAHAILESYEKPYLNGVNGVSDTATFFTPYVFSAASEKSLRANLVAYTEYIVAHPEISPRDLAYTLRERRSVLPYRISFPASNLDRLKNKILMRLEDKGTSLGVRTLGRKGSVAPSRILGVFTGQGAQYARMGAELIDTSPLARSIIRNLEAGLAALPEEDRPTWSLEAEILAEPEFSRMSESAISQPLNTAVQIMLVDLLRSVGVQFGGIIGHSGGEVAAAYAAGFLTARDALCVAYYRGMVCRLAASPNGDVKGAMIAVGTSMEDATQFCEEEEFAGRIVVACVNSSSSVTISGDEDAIDELAVIMDDEKKFNRRLKVDNAYHSMHMRPLVAPYLEGISRAGVKAIIPSSHQCTWYSSVFNGSPVDLSFQLSDKYWVENMVRPVLFSQALTAALNSGTVFDTLLEIGPHAALKSPALQTVQDVMQKTVPYQGALTRGVDAVEAFSATLGMLWSHLDRSSLSLQRGEIALSGKMQHFNVLKDLPTYQWNHDTKYWHESRRSRQIRLRPTPVHPLLGDATAESGPHALRWKNILKPSEMQWVEGHSVQGQIVLPAAAYVSTALEAAKVLAGEKIIRLIELDNFLIHQAVTFGDNDEGVEVLIEMCQISKADSDITTAKFTYSAALGGDNTNLSLAADGQLKIFLGDGSDSLLPERHPAPPHMIPVDETRLYKYMEGLEYNFSGAFRSLVKLQRKLGKSICVAKRASEPGDEFDSLLVHPVDLDAAFQSIMLAYSYPGDEQLRTLHLPTSIAKIRVNPAILAEEKERHDSIDVDSSCNPIDRSNPGSGFSGNVNMYFNGCSNTAIQVDKVIFKPVGTDANDDRKIFCTMDYVPSKLNGYTAASDISVSEYETQLMWGLSRIVNFYVRQFDREVPKGSPFRTESPLCHYLNYAQHMNGLLDRGEAKYAKQEWLSDTIQDVMEDLNAKGYV
jgi:acyl transferase domain-containing protein